LNSTLNILRNQSTGNLLLEELISTTDLKSLIQGYILNCKCEGKSTATLSIYATVLRNFSWYCTKNEYPVIQRLTAIHIRHFLWYLASESNRWGSNNAAAKKPASLTTIHDYYRALKTFFNWLERDQLIFDNPFNYIKPPKTDRKVIEALTSFEINRLFSGCSGNNSLDIRNKAILSLFLDTGLRVSELANLTLEDIDMDSGAILIRHGKGGKQRIVHIGSRAQKALWKYITIYRRTESKRLFINRNGEPLDVIGVKALMKRLGDRAVVKVHPHKLRHTFAISYLRAGGDVFSLQYLLGHTTLQMTQRYLQSLNAEDAVAAHRKFSPLDNLK
jgi:site-specific recombinase XerD